MVSLNWGNLERNMPLSEERKNFLWICPYCGRMHTSAVEECWCDDEIPVKRIDRRHVARGYGVKSLSGEKNDMSGL
jgi:hypothetical protein